MKVTPHIKKITIRAGAAVLTFAIGVAISSVWFRNHDQAAKPFRYLSGPTCREGLVSVESLPDVPLRITIADTACEKPQTASVHFVVENLSTKPIKKYEVHGYLIYDDLIDDGMGVTTERVEPLQPRQTDIGFLGGGVMTRAGGIPVGELKHFRLVLWSVEFADGTDWVRSHHTFLFAGERKQNL